MHLHFECQCLSTNFWAYLLDEAVIASFLPRMMATTATTAVLHHLMSLACCIESHCTLAPAHTPCLFSIDLHTVRQHLVIVHFLLLLLLSGTLFQIMSGVPHHCHHLCRVWRHTCFVQFSKTELYPWSLYICAWFGHVMALLMVFLKMH